MVGWKLHTDEYSVMNTSNSTSQMVMELLMFYVAFANVYENDICLIIKYDIRVICKYFEQYKLYSSSILLDSNKEHNNPNSSVTLSMQRTRHLHKKKHAKAKAGHQTGYNVRTSRVRADARTHAEAHS